MTVMKLIVMNLMLVNLMIMNLMMMNSMVLNLMLKNLMVMNSMMMKRNVGDHVGDFALLSGCHLGEQPCLKPWESFLQAQ